MTEKQKRQELTIHQLYTALAEWQDAHGATTPPLLVRGTKNVRRPTEDELFAVLNRHPWGASEEGDALAEQLCRAIDESIPSLLLLGGSCQ
jgi:hypothetical protein